MTQRHFSVLKQLFPLEIAGVLDEDMHIEGDMLDNVTSDSALVLQEMFPDTAVQTLSDWERSYGITKREATLEARRSVLLRRINETGGLSVSYFQSIAAALGFDVIISLPAPLFRAGISKAGDPVYNIWKLYEINIYVLDNQSDLLESSLNSLLPPDTKAIYTYI